MLSAETAASATYCAVIFFGRNLADTIKMLNGMGQDAFALTV